jgi:small subunit ribosomal protein S6
MKKEKTQIYEGMFILSAVLTDENRQKVLDKITNGIVEKGGEIRKMFDQGRKKMAYPINKRREGHYFIFYFNLPTQAMKTLWRECSLNEEVLRFMTLNVEAVPEKIEFKPLMEI